MINNYKLQKGFCTIVNEKECTGCSACYNSCKSSAISMRTNVIGHIFPFIEKDKCINCGLCIKSCPSYTNNYHQTTIKQVYAAWSKDDHEHLTSTSGGIASTISRAIIRKNGIVYGCASLPKCIFKHIRITQEKDIDLLKGSKYVQSNIELSFCQVKTDLQNGLKVLFIGTPCQISGLKSFLHKDYSNLYTIDLICHGVPSQQLLYDHLKYLGININKVTKIGFRNQNGYFLTVWEDNNIIYKKNHLLDLYYSGFNDALFFRESCVNCNYAKIERAGDITLGDFHGLGTKIPFDINSNGNKSLLAINTIKGEELLTLIKKDIILYERTLNEACKYNPQLQRTTKRKSNYNKFINKYKVKGYEKAVKSSLIIRRIKNILLLTKKII